jgi:hypothetical protein
MIYALILHWLDVDCDLHFGCGHQTRDGEDGGQTWEEWAEDITYGLYLLRSQTLGSHVGAHNQRKHPHSLK